MKRRKLLCAKPTALPASCLLLVCKLRRIRSCHEQTRIGRRRSTGFIGAKYGLPYVEPLTFLGVRMIFVVIILAGMALLVGARWPRYTAIGHSMVAGSLVTGTYLGGVFIAISHGVPAGISALIPGLQPVLTSTIADRFMGEKVTPLQWLGLALGLVGVLLVLHNRSLMGGSWLGWTASLFSLLGITFGTLYQKRYCGDIDWRTGNLVQYVAAPGPVLVRASSSCAT